MKTGTQILAIGTLSTYTGKPVLAIVVLALHSPPTILPLVAVYAALDWHCADRTRAEQAHIQLHFSLIVCFQCVAHLQANDARREKRTMETIECAPDPNLLESMRSFGYSLNTAAADIIDNSISAGAHTIRILFSGTQPNPYIAIVDNGSGMDCETAQKAMQLAGTGTTLSRNENDLGRFGLGLKTASFSQARQLTVVSKQRAEITTLRWDLDTVAQSQQWALESLDAEETKQSSWWQAGASEFVHGDEAVDCLNGNVGSLDIGVDTVR